MKELYLSWLNKLDEVTVSATLVNSFKGKLQRLKAILDEFLFVQ